MTKTQEEFVALDLLIRGFQVSRLIRVVADLSLADKIPVDRSRDVRELAKACGVLDAPLLRVVRALAAFEIFRVTLDGSVSHSPRSLLLRTDAPKGLHIAARFWAGPGSWRAWEKLDVALSGGNPHEAAWNMDRFEYLRQHPEEARTFDAFMAHFPDDRHEAIATAYDFSSASLIVDLGGGNGETLRRILGRYPTPRGLVFDRDDVVAAIPAAARLGGRIAVEGGSFFDHVAPGADVYLLVRVLHDFSDEDCLRVLRTCRPAMPAGARLLVVERMLEPDPERDQPTEYLIDAQMMAMFGGGRERTQAEFEELLRAAGFAATRLIPTSSPVSIIEAALV